jgi:hypothetical protein
MKRSTVSVAMLGIAEEQSRALVAATTVIASRLPADLLWESDAARAEIIILNTGDAAGADLGARFAAENDAVLVPYAPAGACPENGISRPLRMGRLQEALAAAVKRVLERARPVSEEIGRHSYRGQRPDASDTGKGKAQAAAYARVYRGRAV